MARAAAGTAFEDSRVGRDLPEATVQAVCAAFFDEPPTAPFVHGRHRDAELGGDLSRREHAAAAQPVVSARQFVGTSNEGDFLQIEGLGLPGAPSVAVQNFGDLAVAMSVEQLVDGRDKLGLELAQLGDGQRSFELQCACSSAGQPHMGGDLLRLDQRHVIKKQAQEAFALTEVDARVLPDLRQLLGQPQNALASLFALSLRSVATELLGVFLRVF